MIAVDTNILIYAHRGETELHGTAASRLVALAEGAERWALPVFCVTEFMRVVMHRRVFNPPSTVAQATAFIESHRRRSELRGCPTGSGIPRTSHRSPLARQIRAAT